MSDLDDSVYDYSYPRYETFRMMSREMEELMIYVSRLSVIECQTLIDTLAVDMAGEE